MKVEGLFVPLRLSVALSCPLKMSTKALAAIAKVKSDHILKVTLQTVIFTSAFILNFGFVYSLHYVFGSKRKEIDHYRAGFVVRSKGEHKWASLRLPWMAILSKAWGLISHRPDCRTWMEITFDNLFHTHKRVASSRKDQLDCVCDFSADDTPCPLNRGEETMRGPRSNSPGRWPPLLRCLTLGHVYLGTKVSRC